MRGRRQRWLRQAGPILLAALLLVPLCASAHTHTGDHGPLPCATCVAAHHTPAVTATPIAAQSTTALVLHVERPAASRVVGETRRAPTGRAPPPSFVDHDV